MPQKPAALKLLYMQKLHLGHLRSASVWYNFGTMYSSKALSKTRFFFGFSPWKREYVLSFFPHTPDVRNIFCSSLEQAQKERVEPERARFYIWGAKSFGDVERYCKERKIPLYRIEDGFIRSVSLGSDLTRPYSLVVDSRGIYFDPRQPSDLEHILLTRRFDEKLLKRARWVREFLVKEGLSKYNIQNPQPPKFHTDKPVALVVGQVEDDASVVYGGEGMGNLELLKKVRHKKPDHFVVYKPHPDVVAGNRAGAIPQDELEKYADAVVYDHSVPALLEVCDEVHTITSLSGFEALLRGKKVYTYGMPFYAGWGLTEDERLCERRTRRLGIDELVAGALILYPRYVSPQTGKLCGIEQMLKELARQRDIYMKKGWYRGLLGVRNLLVRRLQRMVKAGSGSRA